MTLLRRHLHVPLAGSDSPAGQVASLSIEGSFRDEAKVRCDEYG